MLSGAKADATKIDGHRRTRRKNESGRRHQMTNNQLRAVIDRAFDRERISCEDVRELQREVFEHGLTCREEVNWLAALDRAIPSADPLWAKFFIASVVEFVVWTSRPTGYVDNETARWLVTALMSMDRATVNAHRAALEIVREAQQVGEELLPLLLLPRAGRDLGGRI